MRAPRGGRRRTAAPAARISVPIAAPLMAQARATSRSRPPGSPRNRSPPNALRADDRARRAGRGIAASTTPVRSCGAAPKPAQRAAVSAGSPAVSSVQAVTNGIRSGGWIPSSASSASSKSPASSSGRSSSRGVPHGCWVAQRPRCRSVPGVDRARHRSPTCRAPALPSGIASAAMYAITVREPGGPEVLEWAEVPDPVAGAGEVLIDVAASAVNRADLLQRQGHYPPPPGASEIIGLECGGRIAALGDGRHRLVGRRRGVRAARRRRLRARRSRCRPRRCCPCPPGVDLVTAAALPEVACTVWSNVVATGRLRPGETFLVHGGSSGIGTHGDPGREGAGRPGRRHRGAAAGRPLPGAGRRRRRSTTTTTSPSSSRRRPTGTAPTSSSTTWAPRAWPRTSTRWPPTAGCWSSACRAARKAELNLNTLLRKRAQRHRDEPARPAGGGPARQGRGGRRGPRAGLADDRRRAGAAGRARRRFRWTGPPTRTGSWRPAAWSASAAGRPAESTPRQRGRHRAGTGAQT